MIKPPQRRILMYHGFPFSVPKYVHPVANARGWRVVIRHGQKVVLYKSFGAGQLLPRTKRGDQRMLQEALQSAEQYLDNKIGAIPISPAKQRLPKIRLVRKKSTANANDSYFIKASVRANWGQLYVGSEGTITDARIDQGARKMAGRIRYYLKKRSEGLSVKHIHMPKSLKPARKNDSLVSTFHSIAQG